MKIKRIPLTFHNVLRAAAVCKRDEWYHQARSIRNSVVSNGLYGTGPIIYQVSLVNVAEDEAEYTFHVPLNNTIELENNEHYEFAERLSYEDGLLLRHADLDDDIEESYAILRACAEANQFVLQEPFYNIYLDVYGDGVIDIFAPILKEGTSIAESE